MGAWDKEGKREPDPDLKVIKTILSVEDGEEVGKDGFDGSDDQASYEIESKDIAILVFRID